MAVADGTLGVGTLTALVAFRTRVFVPVALALVRPVTIVGTENQVQKAWIFLTDNTPPSVFSVSEDVIITI